MRGVSQRPTETRHHAPRLMQIADSLEAALDSVTARAEQATQTVLDTGFWYGIGATAVRVALIVFLALLVLGIVGRLRKRWVHRVRGRPTTDKRRQRVLTVADLVGSVARYVVWGVASI